ncbi:hypothetical protein [Saccharopolyspora phatthalungensis]|uniref:Uncharacterized protein n=1 Tax=Saccharopolyspora phatthalungensis TaxID=664693 RepID=A0A840QDY0_9PSEU|nr:hypothetical protein [Saccharopolyspora phatthalungensis]MBB5156868.1 hypothetical protein [Saccharopolyspora phatthalungensis]
MCQRIPDLHDEVGLFAAQIAALIDEIVPELSQAVGVGREAVARLLCTVGENPER